MKQKCLKIPANKRVLGRISGFSLLEVLVAVTLLVLAMSILLQVFSRGVNNADVADRYAKAAMYAESKMATIGVEDALVEGETSGDFSDDYKWRLSVRPYVTTTEPKTLSTIELTAQANGALTNTQNVGLSAAAATQLGNVDIEALLPVRLYEVELTVVFRTDDSRERVVTLNTMKIGQKI
jgi:general secretion pathway protein I